MGLPFSDRGTRYGMSLFETCRVFNGRPQFWEEHLQRLLDATARCGFSVRAEALHAAGGLFPINSCEGVARLYVTAGDGLPADPVKECRVALLFEERRRSLPESYTLAMSSSAHIPPFSGLKTGNYWTNAESLRQARAAGADEALLFGPGGDLQSACMANVFLKTPDSWVTPSLSCGAREGVVRAWTFKHLRVREARLKKADVLAAEAIFLTSSWIGLMPVRQIGTVILGHAKDEAANEVAKLRREWESQLLKDSADPPR